MAPTKTICLVIFIKTFFDMKKESINQNTFTQKLFPIYLFRNENSLFIVYGYSDIHTHFE